MARTAFSVGKVVGGFVAGFLATLVFHQLTLALLWSGGITAGAPFSMAPTMPFGVPALFSLAFWGGVWGIVLNLARSRFPRGAFYWITAFLFGAILPSLVALLVVFPLKGRPIGGGWRMPVLVTVFLVNGAWGVGTALILKAFRSGR